MNQVWAGVDIGKEHHHCVVIDGDGKLLLSQRVLNDEPALASLVADVASLSADVQWAVDVIDGGAALLLALLARHHQAVVYLPGLTVNRASATYKGQGKTDAKDAFVIADQARMRRNLDRVQTADPTSIDLRVLTAARADLVTDRTRQINRIRTLLLELCPALERALDLTNLGPVILLTGFQRPAQIREAGADELASWLRDHGVRTPATLAKTVVKAAESQSITLPGEMVASAIVARMAADVLKIDREIAELESLIDARFTEHPYAAVIQSLPGMGRRLGAEFLAATGGDMALFSSADRLASYGGLAPAPRDSGRVSGNLHRPRRFNRVLLRVFYLSSFVSLRCCPASRAFYDRKRAEGKGHKQALLALARRRVNVLWAMLRDGTFYEPSTGLGTSC